MLDGCRLDRTVAQVAGESLPHNGTLRSLSLRDNKFGESSFEGGDARDVGVMLGDAISKNGALTHLDLARTHGRNTSTHKHARIGG